MLAGNAGLGSLDEVAKVKDVEIENVQRLFWQTGGKVVSRGLKSFNFIFLQRMKAKAVVESSSVRASPLFTCCYWPASLFPLDIVSAG